MKIIKKYLLFISFALLSSNFILNPNLSLANDNTAHTSEELKLDSKPATENADQNPTKISYPVQAKETIGELWTGSIYSSTYRAGACFSPDGTVKGVLLLKLKNGKVITYHFNGTKDEKGIIRAEHSSGYKFRGKFDSVVDVSGKVTLKSGFKINVEGMRLQNSKLTESCGPLPE